MKEWCQYVDCAVKEMQDTIDDHVILAPTMTTIRLILPHADLDTTWEVGTPCPPMVDVSIDPPTDDQVDALVHGERMHQPVPAFVFSSAFPLQCS